MRLSTYRYRRLCGANSVMVHHVFCHDCLTLYGPYAAPSASLSNLYGPIPICAESTGRGTCRSSANEVPHGSEKLFEKPISDTREGSKRVKNPALLFVLEATVVIGLIVLVGLSGENIAPHTAQNAETSSSQN